MIDEAYPLGCGGIDGIAGQDHLIGPALAHKPREPLGAAVAGDQTQPDLGLADRVHIVDGLRPDDPGLVDAFHGADVFCLPSVHEPFGIVVLEAWAAGIPVVASRVGGIPGFVREGNDALLVDARDVAGRADALVTLLRNAELAGTLATAGRRRARGEFDWSVIAGRVADLYRDVVASRS